MEPRSENQTPTEPGYYWATGPYPHDKDVPDRSVRQIVRVACFGTELKAIRTDTPWAYNPYPLSDFSDWSGPITETISEGKTLSSIWKT